MKEAFSLWCGFYQTPKISKIIGDVPDFLDKSGFSFAERPKKCQQLGILSG